MGVVEKSPSKREGRKKKDLRGEAKVVRETRNREGINRDRLVEVPGRKITEGP